MTIRGFKHSEETKQKIAVARKKYCDEHPGYKHSEETKQKTSGTLKEYYKEHPRSEETCRKLSESHSRWYKENPEKATIRRENIVKGVHAAHERDPNIKKKCIEFLSNYRKSHPEMDMESSTRMKARWKDPSQRKKFLEWSRRGIGKKENTKPEKLVRGVLDDFVVRYEPQGRLREVERVLGRIHFFDFVLPEDRIVIEADGCYWHCCSKCFPKEYWDDDSRINPSRILKRDQEVNTATTEAGWQILRFWEHDLYTDLSIVHSTLVGSGL